MSYNRKRILRVNCITSTAQACSSTGQWLMLGLGAAFKSLSFKIIRTVGDMMASRVSSIPQT